MKLTFKDGIRQIEHCYKSRRNSNFTFFEEISMTEMNVYVGIDDVKAVIDALRYMM